MSECPTVSLLVAMRNEAKYIGDCLRSILDQDYPAGLLEVIVIDGQSEDGSRQIVEHLIAGRPGWRLVENPERIQSAGWNRGIELSTGQVIGIVSGHSELATDYVSQAVETLQRTGADLVGGCMCARSATNTGKAIALATSSRFGVGGARFHYATSESVVDTVYMGLCRREVYQRIGGFDTEMVRDQDDEWSYRLRKCGGRIVCNPRIRSVYHNRTSFRTLWKQYYEYGLWKIRVMQKHPWQMQWRHCVPMLFVGALCLAAVVGMVVPDVRIIGGAIVATYISANVVAACSAAVRHRFAFPWLISAAYGILHGSYGMGSIHGLCVYLATRIRWPTAVAPPLSPSVIKGGK